MAALHNMPQCSEANNENIPVLSLLMRDSTYVCICIKGFDIKLSYTWDF